MADFLQSIADFFHYVFNQIASLKISDAVDILLVSIIFYYAYRFVRQRRAGKLALGILAFVLIMWISNVAGLNALNYIMDRVFDVGIIALIIIFQPELRSALEKMGGNFHNLNPIAEAPPEEKTLSYVDELCSAVEELSKSCTGALIVMEKTTRLGDEIKTGVLVDAEINRFLIGNIFYNKAPLHDGAMIIREGRIHACGCFLPLTGNPNLPKEYGTRHRAGLGISEISDAFVVIVSEETGDISVARNGEIDKGISVKVLRHRMTNEFLPRRGKKKGVRKAQEESNHEENSTLEG